MLSVWLASANAAMVNGAMENPIGPVCRFSLYHLMEVESALELFPYRFEEVGA